MCVPLITLSMLSLLMSVVGGVSSSRVLFPGDTAYTSNTPVQHPLPLSQQHKGGEQVPAAGPLPVPFPSSNHPLRASLPRIPETMGMTPQEQVDQARRRPDAFTTNMIALH